MDLAKIAEKLPRMRKGNVQFAFGLAMMAIALYMATIVIGEMSSLNSGLSGTALSGFNNVTYYVFIGLRIGAIGLLVYAAMNMFGWFGIGGGRSRR